MISPKLIVLLRSFTKYDLNAFNKFIRSPFHNENQELIRLFDIINNILRKNEEKTKHENQLAKEKVWELIFHEEKYVDETMRRLCSELTKKAYQFLSYQQFRENELNELIYLLPTINTPNLDKHFSGVLRQVKSIQEKSTIKNFEYHYQKFQIEQNIFVHLEKPNEKIKSFENLENADFHLDCFYISKKLKHYCDAIAYSKISSTIPDINLFPSFIEFLSKSDFLNQPEIKAYFLILQMLLDSKEDKNFQELKKFLKSNTQIFPISELKSIYIHLMNYCIDTKINNGHSEYFLELFDIYKTLIDNNIIFDEGELSPSNYKNIITVGCHIEEFDWTENFIQNYTQFLPKKSQDNDLSYNLATVYFHKKDYPKVIEQFRDFEYQNLTYAMGGRQMLLKTYYEMKEYKALDSLLDSYSIYLRRNKMISKEIRQQRMNGIRFTRKLISVAPYDKKRIEKLKEQITNCKALAAKKWLLEKVEELT